MSVHYMATVWKHSKASEGSLLVLLAIADHAGDDGKAWPGLQLLARKSRLSERDTRYCLRKLEKLGELRVTRQKKENGSWGSNLYEILLTPLGQILPHPPAEHCPTLEQLVAPPLESSLEPSVEPNTPFVHPPLNGSAEPNGHSPTRLTPRRRSAPVCEPSGDFLEWWDVYPRHEKMKDAWKAWQSMPKSVSLETIMNATKEHQRKRWRHCEKRHIPYPATWIRAEQWDDEL